MPNKSGPSQRGTADGVTLDQAAAITRTGDLWLFRGRKPGDRAIQVATNSPVNHVGMAVVLDDLPPLLWHAELGRSLPDVWSGQRHRGVQLHDLRAAVTVWAQRYGQRAWLRQLDPPAAPEADDAVLRTIARLDGTPFPSTAGLASRWLRGRVPSAGQLPSVAGWRALSRPAAEAVLETAYCAEVLAVTYQAMGLLDRRHQSSWYDPGRFWSGDDLRLTGGHRLGGEIPVTVPASKTTTAGGHERPEWGQGAGMGAFDKLKNRFQMGKGHAKQDVGRATNNRSMEAEGQGDRVAGSTKQVGEQVKDAGKNVKDAFKNP
jgi:uncharacterized protein YjbJ (UPF0337 family)